MTYQKRWRIIVPVITGCFVLVGIIIILVVGHLRSPDGKGRPYPPTIAIDEDLYYPVISILDGDTFKVQVNEKETKEITVRMLGIDTPETVDPRKPAQCYGREASNETRSLLSGQKVQLKLNPTREVRDKFGRYLAYVYREDGLFVNGYLLKEGFAREYTYGKAYEMQREFRKLEREAEKQDKGLWSKCYTNSTNNK